MTKEEQILEDLINKMFEIAGHDVTYDDIKGRKDAWYTDWTMTMGQYEQWKLWGYRIYQEKFKDEKDCSQETDGLVCIELRIKI